MPFNLCKTVEVEPEPVGLPVMHEKLERVENVDILMESDLKDEVDDDLSERCSSMSTPNTKEITPYHLLEVKVAEIQEQLENIASVPSNKHLFEKTRTQYEEKPIGEMQLASRVETNENGIAKCMSMIEDMTKQMQNLRDEHKQQMDQIKGNDMNDKFNTLACHDDCKQFVTRAELEDALQDTRKVLESKLPSHDELEQFVTLEELIDVLQGIEKDLESKLSSSDAFKQFVTRKELEDYLQGAGKDLESKLSSPDDFEQVLTWGGLADAIKDIRQDAENLQQPTEKVEIGMSSETDSVPSRPTSSHSVKLHQLTESHEALTRQVEELEAEMRNKLDQSAVAGLNVSSQLLEQPQELKEQVDAPAAAREQVQDALLKSQNETREEFKKMLAYCDELQWSKADRTDVDVKADKTSLDNKVDHSLFNTQINDIAKTFNVIADQMEENEESWNQQRKVLSDDIDEKVDRLELEPLKEWLLKRLEALNDKLNKQNQAPVELIDDAADQKEWLQSKLEVLDDELEKQNQTPVELIDDAADQKEWLQSKLEVLDDELEKQNQSPVELIDDAADQKEWLQSKLEVLDDELEKQNQSPVELIDDAADQKERLQSKLEVLNDELNKQNQAPVELTDEAADQKERLQNRLEVLNDELKKQNQAPVELIDEAADQKERLQSRLEVLNDELKKQNQAPVELIDEAADQKERLQSRLEVLNDELKKQNQAPVELIDEAADQKERLQSKLEVLDDELKKQNQSPVELIDEAAAGIRSLVPLSMPSVSSHQALLPRRSQMPRLTVKTDQIRQHTKSDTSMCTIINTNRRRNNDYFDRSLTRRQKASQGQRIIKSDNNKTKRPKTRRSKSNTVTEKPEAIMSQSDQEAFQTHFGNNVEDFQKGFLIQRIDRNDNANADCYARNRSCGGQHTTTYPHSLWTREDKEAQRG